MHGRVGLLTDILMAVLQMSCPLMTLCHLTYNYQFFIHFLPILDDLHSQFSGGGGEACPESPHFAHANAFAFKPPHFKICSSTGPVQK